jgi:hypothetical protein
VLEGSWKNCESKDGGLTDGVGELMKERISV